MEYLKRGLNRSLDAIKKRKLLFTSICVLQIILFIGIVFLLLIFEVRILNDVKGIMEPLQDTGNQIQSVDDLQDSMKLFLPVIQSYKSLKTNILSLLGYLTLIFLVPQAWLWILTQQLFENKSTSLKTKLIIFGQQWLKYVLFSIVLFGPIFLGIYFMIKNVLTFGLESILVLKIPAIIITAGLYYLLLISFAFLGDKSWKIFFNHFLKAAIKRIDLTLPILLINLIIVSLWGFLLKNMLYISDLEITGKFFVTLLVILIFISSFVFTRLFWIATLRELYHEKSNN